MEFITAVITKYGTEKGRRARAKKTGRCISTRKEMKRKTVRVERASVKGSGVKDGGRTRQDHSADLCHISVGEVNQLRGTDDVAVDTNNK